MKRLVLIIFLLSAVLSCTKKVIPPTEISGLDYFPLTLGRFVVYKVDSIVYGEIPRDTTHHRYLVKEVISEEFTDAEGKTSYRLDRYIKKYDAQMPYDSMSWTMKEVYMINADKNKVQVQENNIRFTKLVFPVEEGRRWNGNAQNTLGEQNYSYEYVDRTEIIGSINLGKVLSVKQIEFPTLISYKLAREKYASGVGLIYKKIVDVRSNNVIHGVDIRQRIESGIDYEQTLISFGNE